MSSSQLDPIGHKLQSLENRLRAESESHDRLFPETLMETTPNRQSRRMFLPVKSPTPAPETETDKKLKKIMKQTGILAINGQKYCTDIKDLEHMGDLGNGTSGNVVKMRHIPSGTVIAVKQMRRTGNSEENKRILMDLDVVLKSHDCPYIVQCLGCFVRDPDVWICMELMSMCFDKLLKLSKKPVPEDILGKVTVATVKALSYLKEKHGVIHRDVKPSNILIDERGNIKLCDFGISGRLIESKANTRSAGCAAYMAPERIDPKKPKYDIRADVWSLGITLVELATARSPYEGCNNDFEVLTKVLDSDPPSLPYDEKFNFSLEFRDFVSKCLTKNHQDRPKYPELLKQPFILKYEVANIDVPKWFQSVVESAGIKTHRTNIPKTNQDSSTIPNNNINSNSIITSAAAATAAASALPLATSNAKTYSSQTQIPSYQQFYQNRNRRDENQHVYKATKLPQPIGIGMGSMGVGVGVGGSGGGSGCAGGNGFYAGTLSGGSSGIGNSSCSSSTASSSPLSPPNYGTSSYYGNRDDRDGVNSNNSAYGTNNELNKYFQNSPLLQRKYSNSGAHTFNSLDSPKKETVPTTTTTSVLSTIGQSIIRNLTSSPFSQKKQTIVQTNQIDPLLRGPVGGEISAAFDLSYDPSMIINKSYSNSPYLGRKRIPTVDEKIIAAATGTPPNILREMEYPQKQSQINLVPNDKRENYNSSQTAASAGSHSPIVLQRFYHQQNQLREKEIERHRTTHSPDNQRNNPFISNYKPTNKGFATATATNGGSVSDFDYNQYYSHIPIPTATGCGGATSTSSHSTSSQSSSTLSSSSQLATMPAVSNVSNENYDIGKVLNLQTSSAFGIGSTGGHLQYQPLPQQYLQTNTIRNSRSPPTSPEQLSEPITGSKTNSVTGSMVNKLHKFYARRQLQGTSSLGASSNSSNNSRLGVGSDISMNSSKENNPKEDHGWFNTLAGAMKRQFASYVKLQLNSSAPSPSKSSNAPPHATTSSAEVFSNSGRSSLPYYPRSNSLTVSGGGENANSNSLSSTELRQKGGIEGSTGSFLRRYAASSGGGVGVGSVNRLGDYTAPVATTANAHLLAGLDRRHRSPDPPPRYNRGQSPLLLRKNLLELSGQPPGGSPLLNRRYVSASPPLPPPRRGSESVPGSPQHFRTRIHYTPEPQRRIYRTIDQ